MRKFESGAAFLSFLLAGLIALPALGEESRIVVEADGSKHWNNLYGNGYAAARILDRVAEMKRQDYEKARLGFQLEAEAMVRAAREEKARHDSMLAKERAEFDGLQREYRRLHKEIMESGRSRIERAEHVIFQLKVSDTVQVKKSNSEWKGIRGVIVKIESGEATVKLEAGLSHKFPTHQLINLRALPMNQHERDLVNQYHDAQEQAWNHLRKRLEETPSME